MSGHALARAIRSDPAVREIPLVALTGYGQAGDQKQTAEAGFDDHLVKPVDPESLEAVLARMNRALG